MLIEHFHAPGRRKPRSQHLSAALKVAERLDSLPASELVAAFLAATLGEVRISGDRYEARAYGIRATSVRNRTQAVRNWILAVAHEAAMAPVGEVA